MSTNYENKKEFRGFNFGECRDIDRNGKEND